MILLQKYANTQLQQLTNAQLLNRGSALIRKRENTKEKPTAN